jgi:hypothetical protein
MVAFELAQVHEKAGALSEATRWFTTAAERFRRPQWKQKAEEALIRLGAPIPSVPAEAAAGAVDQTVTELSPPPEPVIAEFSEEQSMETAPELSDGQQESVFEQPPSETQAAAPEPDQNNRRRRRGRRGGRGRRKGTRAAAPAAVAVAPAPQPVPPSMFDRVAEPAAFPAARPPAELAESRTHEPEPVQSHEATGASSAASVRIRSGDPALSSRMTQLESQLRRLLACSLHSVDEPDEAPAGPGVFIITDTDQTTYYYAEACQTLRVGIGNLLRGGRGSREGANLKEKLAEHLGINEARVGKYLKDHCAVRWLQLDEGASLLAHFAVAVLRPVANE